MPFRVPLHRKHRHVLVLSSFDNSVRSHSRNAHLAPRLGHRLVMPRIDHLGLPIDARCEGPRGEGDPMLLLAIGRWMHDGEVVNRSVWQVADEGSSKASVYELMPATHPEQGQAPCHRELHEPPLIDVTVQGGLGTVTQQNGRRGSLPILESLTHVLATGDDEGIKMIEERARICGVRP